MRANTTVLLRSVPTEQSRHKVPDFTVTRFLMKLFRTSNTDIIKDCCNYFKFKLPSELIPVKT